MEIILIIVAYFIVCYINYEYRKKYFMGVLDGKKELINNLVSADIIEYDEKRDIITRKP